MRQLLGQGRARRIFFDGLVRIAQRPENQGRIRQASTPGQPHKEEHGSDGVEGRREPSLAPSANARGRTRHGKTRLPLARSELPGGGWVSRALGEPEELLSHLTCGPQLSLSEIQHHEPPQS